LFFDDVKLQQPAGWIQALKCLILSKVCTFYFSVRTTLQQRIFAQKGAGIIVKRGIPKQEIKDF
jgi:hypothetical protein